MRAGIVGVGAMGMGMARALLDRGFTVGVHDLVAAKEEEARSHGAFVARDASDLAGQVDVVDAIQTGQVLAAIAPGVPTIMCSTIAPADTERLARGRALLDAPISGGPARARAGQLSMMLAGDDALFERCRAVIEAVAAKVFRISATPGDGSRMKVVNNMLAAANLAAGAEAMAMAMKLGLDAGLASKVVAASSGQSWIFDDRMPRATSSTTPASAASPRTTMPRC
jgi:putative dehydrogenase